jgi:thiol-disulfide isomerase/thioredoxin
MKSSIFIFALFFSTFDIFAQERLERPTIRKSSSSPSQQKPDEAAPQASEEVDLKQAIQSSGGSEQSIMDNLDGFLLKHPNSKHKGEIEQELFKLATKLQNRDRAIAYGEKILIGDVANIEILTAMVTNLRSRKGEGDVAKALGYGDRLVKSLEDIFATRTKPMKVSPALWERQKGNAFGAIHLLRGQIHNDLGNLEKAEADFLKSYKQSPTAAAAEGLAGIAEKRKNTEQAIDYYAQAFVRSMDSEEGVDRADLRKKLGQLYVQKNNSEKGLGDLVMKTYDSIVKEDAAKLAKLEPPSLNDGVNNPMEYRLTKLSGGEVKLSDYKGKVIVANFWATWCGPCREEMPMLERAMLKYKDDQDVVFLAINTDDDRNYVDPYVKGQKVKLPVVYANDLDVIYRINAIPTTMVFNREGQISYRQSGFGGGDFVGMISERIEAAKKK